MLHQRYGGDWVAAPSLRQNNAGRKQKTGCDRSPYHACTPFADISRRGGIIARARRVHVVPLQNIKATHYFVTEELAYKWHHLLHHEPAVTQDSERYQVAC